jgi:uncharacterized protein with HEPN domain
MPRRDELYLLDILEAAEALAGYLLDQDFASFQSSPILRDAVERRLMVIGEAAARISDELKASFPDLPWQEARGIRNQIAHRYFSLSTEIVYRTAVDDIPALARQVANILDAITDSSSDGP